MVSCGISTSFPVLFPTERKVAHALLTRPPLEHFRASSSMSPLDLHVLSTPPAFVLSQDQTLSFNPVYIFTGHTSKTQLIRNYCHNFAFLVLYRFQGSVLTPQPSAARVSLHIISPPKEIVNTFFQLFLRFFASFGVCERYPKSNFPLFWFWHGHLYRVLPKIVRGFGTCSLLSFTDLPIDISHQFVYKAHLRSHLCRIDLALQGINCHKEVERMTNKNC